MLKHEVITKIQEMLGTEATALDAAYMYDYLADTYEDQEVEDTLRQLDEAAFLEAANKALERGANELQAEMQRYWSALPNSVRDLLDERRLLEAIREWIKQLDHMASSSTSETCLLGDWWAAEDRIEENAHHTWEAREAYADVLRWWSLAYKVLTYARRYSNADLATVCEYLRAGNLDAAAEEAGMDELSWW